MIAPAEFCYTDDTQDVGTRTLAQMGSYTALLLRRRREVAQAYQEALRGLRMTKCCPEYQIGFRLDMALAVSDLRRLNAKLKAVQS